MEKKTNGLAVASLVLGIVAFIFFWMPLVKIVTFIFGIPGLILGLCGLIHPNKPLAIVSSVICFLAIILAIAL